MSIVYLRCYKTQLDKWFQMVLRQTLKQYFFPVGRRTLNLIRKTFCLAVYNIYPSIAVVLVWNRRKWGLYIMCHTKVLSSHFMFQLTHILAQHCWCALYFKSTSRLFLYYSAKIERSERRAFTRCNIIVCFSQVFHNIHSVQNENDQKSSTINRNPSILLTFTAETVSIGTALLCMEAYILHSGVFEPPLKK